ncbi:MAG: DUF4157 domain-containing protein [Magnetospirillum sp.]|nr:DUF4157 domain-containing protein [Magnetospirillum sp.]
MAGRVIQGYFPGGQMRPTAQARPGMTPRMHAPPPQPGSAPPAVRPMLAQPQGRPLQAQGAASSFPVDPRQLGLGAGRGAPLPPAVQAQMETMFRADFSTVRVHEGPQAARIGAIAFTTGDHIYFAPGRYRTDTPQGRQLLGHELAHVVQQRQGRVRAPAGSDMAVVHDCALEAEAERMGVQAAGWAPAAPPGRTAQMKSSGRLPPAAGLGWRGCVQRMLANKAAEPSQATYLTAYNETTNQQLCENLQSAVGAHAEDRLIDQVLPAAALAGQLDPVNRNRLLIGINRSPCTSEDHLGNGQPSSNKGGGAPGCAQRLIDLQLSGRTLHGTHYTFQLVITVRGLYGSNAAERANSASAIEVMDMVGITVDQSQLATSTRFMDTTTAKNL